MWRNVELHSPPESCLFSTEQAPEAQSGHLNAPGGVRSAHISNQTQVKRPRRVGSGAPNRVNTQSGVERARYLRAGLPHTHTHTHTHLPTWRAADPESLIVDRILDSTKQKQKRRQKKKTEREREKKSQGNWSSVSRPRSRASRCRWISSGQGNIPEGSCHLANDAHCTSTQLPEGSEVTSPLLHSFIQPGPVHTLRPHPPGA